MGGWIHKFRDLMRWDGDLEAENFNVPSGGKVYLSSTSYLIYNEQTQHVELWVNSVLVADWG